MSKKIQEVPQWTGYHGNKHKLIPMIVKLVPKHTGCFVDLFGGIGIVGANVYRFNRCKRVVYNDLEYDLMKALEYIHDTDPRELVNEQDRIINSAFGDADKIEMRHKDIWNRLVEEYNETRLMFWDCERGTGDYREAYEMKGYGIPNITRSDAGLWELFIFLTRHSFRETPRLSYDGRKLSVSPKIPGRLKRNDPSLLAFAQAWHDTPVEFFSCNFTDGWVLGQKHKRPRPEGMVEQFRETIGSLNGKDFVFIDPPYHDSKASYNGKWARAMEIYLLAFCQMLDERGVKFLITNNLYWNKTIFAEWIKQFQCYTLDEDAPKLYQDAEKSRLEVFVSNDPRYEKKYKVPEGLVRIEGWD